MTADLDRIERITRQLTEDDAEWLRFLLLSRRERAARSRAERDRLIRQATAQLSNLPATQAAERLSAMIERRLRAFDTPAPPSSDTLATLIDQIVFLNGFRSLTGRRIHSIASKN